MQELLLMCPEIKQHPEWLVAAMTNLLVNAEALLPLNCRLFNQASYWPGSTVMLYDVTIMHTTSCPACSQKNITSNPDAMSACMNIQLLSCAPFCISMTQQPLQMTSA